MSVVKPKPRQTQTARDYRPAAVIRMPVFWLMYLMFVLVASGGLMTAAQIGPIAEDFKIANVPVSLLGLTHLVFDFSLNSQIAWNEVKLIGNFGVRFNSAVYRRKSAGEVAVMLIRFSEESTCVGNTAVVPDLARKVD